MKMRHLLLIIAVALLFSACQDAEMVQQAPPPKKIKKPVAPPVAAPVPPVPDSVCIAAVGDIMLGTSYPAKNTLPPDSAKNSFVNVINNLRGADVTFGNLEGTLMDKGAPAYYKLHFKSVGYLFRMPVSYGTVLKDAGFNVLSLANNHIGDFGEPGRASTMKALDSLGINYGGQVSHPSAVFKIKGITYGFCAFAPSGETLSIFDMANARQVIRDLKQQCDIVIVSFHGGGEGAKFEHVPFGNQSFYSEKRGNVRAFAHNAVNAGADIILGNGPHVCRAMEIYKNRLIAYSLGNFCTYRSVSIAGVCGISPILKVYVNKKGEFLNGKIISARQTREGGLEPDSLNRAVTRIKALTRVDFPHSGLTIEDDGRILKDTLNATKLSFTDSKNIEPACRQAGIE
jgi:poly-gamma-glutamate capsule biosynthesis protein CapA/YwtB (metallophosphatase superfamily)